jgi:hypothetical protein
MLSPSKHFLQEYKPLIVNMAKDSTIITTTKTNYEFLCDAKTLLGLACVLPLLEVVHGLSKFAQGCHTFICNFVVVFKLCEANP